MSGGKVGVYGAPVSPLAEFGTLPAHVESRLDRDPTTGCWTWIGGLDTAGYGQVGYRWKTWLVHRLVYTQLVGPIPEGLTLDHLCRNPPCCNPDHLEPVTRRENIQRGMVGENMRSKTHCPQGHPYDEVNAYRTPSRNRRECRTCLADRRRNKRGALGV